MANSVQKSVFYTRRRKRNENAAFAAGTVELADQLRRDPPGQQTDNRLIQSSHYRGVIYIAIRAIMDALLSSTIQINRKHRRYHRTSLRRLEKALPTPHAQSQDEQFRPFDDPDHSLVKLIDRPNRTETFNEILAQMVLQYHLTGSALLWANPGEKIPVPRELYVLPTALCWAQPPAPLYPEGWWRVAQYYPAGGFGMLPSPIQGGGAPVDGRDVFVFKNPHPLWRWDAYSPLTAGADQLTVLESIDRSRLSAMQQGLTPDMVLLAPGVQQGQLDVYLEKLRQTNMGDRNFRKVMAIGGDQGDSKFDVKFPNVSAKDMDFGSGWDQMTAYALALFGVPKSVAALATTGSYAELYAALKQFHTLTLRPMVTRLGAWLTRHLAHIWGKDLAIQLDLPTIDDQQLQEQQLGTDLQFNGLTYNEYRAVRGRKPVPGGDVLVSIYVQNQQAKAQAQQQAQQPQPGADPQAAPAQAQAGAPDPSSSNGPSALPGGGAGEGVPQGAAPEDGDPLAALLGHAAPGSDDGHVHNSVTDAALAALGVPAQGGTVEKAYEPQNTKGGGVRKPKPVEAAAPKPTGAGTTGSVSAPPRRTSAGDVPISQESDPAPGEHYTAGGDGQKRGAPYRQTGEDRPAAQPAPEPSVAPTTAADLKPQSFVKRTAAAVTGAARGALQSAGDQLNQFAGEWKGAGDAVGRAIGPAVSAGSKTAANQSTGVAPEPAQQLTGVPTTAPTPYPAGRSSVPVTKPGGAPRKEGEVWQGPSGRWLKLQGGRPVPTADPSAPPTEPAYDRATGPAPLTPAALASAASPQPSSPNGPLGAPAPIHPELPPGMGLEEAANLATGGNSLARLQLPNGSTFELQNNPQSLKRFLDQGGRFADNPLVATRIKASAPQAVQPIPNVAETVKAGGHPPESAFVQAATAVTAPTPAARAVLARADQWADAQAARHAGKVATFFGIPEDKARELLAHAIRSVAKNAVAAGHDPEGFSKVDAPGGVTDPSTGKTFGFKVRYNPRTIAARQTISDAIQHLHTGGDLTQAEAGEGVAASEHMPQKELEQSAQAIQNAVTPKEKRLLDKVVNKWAGAVERLNPDAAEVADAPVVRTAAQLAGKAPPPIPLGGESSAPHPLDAELDAAHPPGSLPPEQHDRLRAAYREEATKNPRDKDMALAISRIRAGLPAGDPEAAVPGSAARPAGVGDTKAGGKLPVPGSVGEPDLDAHQAQIAQAIKKTRDQGAGAHTQQEATQLLNTVRARTRTEVVRMARGLGLGRHATKRDALKAIYGAITKPQPAPLRAPRAPAGDHFDWLASLSPDQQKAVQDYLMLVRDRDESATPPRLRRADADVLRALAERQRSRGRNGDLIFVPREVRRELSRRGARSSSASARDLISRALANKRPVKSGRARLGTSGADPQFRKAQAVRPAARPVNEAEPTPAPVSAPPAPAPTPAPSAPASAPVREVAAHDTKRPGEFAPKGQPRTQPVPVPAPAPVAAAPAAPPAPAPTPTPDPQRAAMYPRNSRTGLVNRSLVGMRAFQLGDKASDIPRLPNLSPKQRKVETAYAEHFGKNPERLADEYLKAVAAGAVGVARNVFATDDVKMLNPSYNPNGLRTGEKLDKESKKAMARYNLAIHGTANAVAKRALVKYMRDVVAHLPPEKRSILVTNGGVACHGRDTPVLMFDGSIKMVQDVVVGDLVMGPDSAPRKVMKAHAGIGQMYRVLPKRGKAFTVNGEHVLSLKTTRALGSKKRKNVVVTNITVNEVLARGQTFIKNSFLYRAGVDFKHSPVPIDPYFLGLWLGDGTHCAPSITSADPETAAYLTKFTSRYPQLCLVVTPKPNNKASNYRLSLKSSVPHPKKQFGSGDWRRNPITDALRSIGVWRNKHIPQRYLVNDRETRLQVLAGLLDSDGHLDRRDGNKGFSIITNRPKLAANIEFLARSLGFATYAKIVVKKNTLTGASGKYHQMQIAGDVSEIPTKLSRKRAAPRVAIKSNGRGTKDVLRTGYAIEPIGYDEFFGFTLDGDHLYLLDDFTVTHNSGKGSSLSRAADPESPYHGMIPHAGQVGVVWDAAGEQNGTENQWILQEARKLGIKPIFAYTWADPKDTWDHPERGVVRRAIRKGRMVDAKLWAESHAEGPRNFNEFHERHKDDSDAQFVVIDNRKKGAPVAIQRLPQEALSYDADELHRHALTVLEERKGELDPNLVKAGTAGVGIWGAPRPAGKKRLQ